MEAKRRSSFRTHSCLVAERHRDRVRWAIAEYAWCFTAVNDEAL